MTMDTINETILVMVRNHASLREMKARTGRSIGGVRLRLMKLAENGYVTAPPKKMARSYLITEKGLEYLTTMGYIK